MVLLLSFHFVESLHFLYQIFYSLYRSHLLYCLNVLVFVIFLCVNFSSFTTVDFNGEAIIYL